MAVVTIPGSKSVTARALLLAAAANGRTTLVDPLRSDDTEAFIDGLRALGYHVVARGREWTIDGRAGGPGVASAEVFCRDGATAARFLPALAAAGHGTFAFDASEQMRARPMAPLTDALRSLGAGVTFTGESDHHPFVIEADGIAGGSIRLDAGTSSQFLTALLLVAPLSSTGLTIEVADLVSVPYVGITLAMMRDFGVDVAVSSGTYTVPAGTYLPQRYQVEPDASSASYFFAAAALLGRTVTVPGLGTQALQGDLAFVRVLEEMGAEVRQTRTSTTVTGGQLRGVTVNMRDISDTMPTLAAIAPYAEGPTTIVDVANTRVKECDRLEACAVNLRRLGVDVDTGPDWIRISPGTPHAGRVETFRDHRIAMAFSIAGLRTPGITLDDPGCVKKTFPTFHDVLSDVVEEFAVEVG
jgi:3-phosphoshikimate 1-carboxyvinyltransferase